MRTRQRLSGDGEPQGFSPDLAEPANAPPDTSDPVSSAPDVPVAGLRDLVRPATIVLLLVPLSVLGAGTSTAGRVAVVAAITALVLVAALLVVSRTLRFRRSYAWLAVFAGLLAVSFACPSVTEPAAPQAEPPRVAGLLGMGLTPGQLSLLPDLAGLLAGLALTGLSVATAPHPRQVARVIALSGAAAAAYVLVRGGFDNTRLEGLGCNPNYLGFVLVLPLLAGVGLTRHARNARWLLPAGLCAIALSATHSRAAFLAALLGVAVILVQGRSRLFQALLASVVVAGTGTAAVTGMLHPMARHIENLGAGGRTATDLSLSNGMRMNVARFAAHVVMEHPLRGIGYGMFPGYAERSPRFGVYLATHDDFLRLAAEAGIPALTVFLILLRPALAFPRSGDAAVLRALMPAYVVILFFANPLASLVVSAPFWVALGCLLAPGREAAPGPAGAARGAGRLARRLRRRIIRGGVEPDA